MRLVQAASRTAAAFGHMVLLILLVNATGLAIPMSPRNSAGLIPGASAATATERTVRIVAFGDSLTAGFGLPQSAAFPVQLERALKAKGHAVEIINAGVSGDTTAAGLERFDWSVPENVDAAILELGANDALRGLAPGRARANLEAIMQRMAARKLDVLVAGMAAPRNWGESYVREFEAIFPDLAKAHGALLYPFFLEGVAMRSGLNQSDGMHPTEAGVAEIVERILPLVEQLIARVEARRVASGR